MGSDNHDVERHQQIKALYAEARSLPRSELESFLEEACGDDDDVRDEVRALLSFDADESSFLDKPVPASLALQQAVLPPGAHPQFVGEFEIVRAIGEGGMGTVYEARQSHPKRTVAVKVLRPGASSAESMRRFEFEAAYLGRLQHPGIAQIYEAGTQETPTGVFPYFAMELIDGVPLTEYARRESLDWRAIVGLGIQVCEAIEHAHQKGLIHRDLKPANILVDAQGQPKVLDFGIARAVDADLAHSIDLTQVGQLVGTLGYMSPEQAGGAARDVDTRSDVYSLGVILYELLAKRVPYELSTASLIESLRTIQDVDPPRLGSIDRQLRGDTEIVISKALEKDPSRRYSSAAELASDLRRLLSDQPIDARATTHLYRLRKFTRRHKAIVTAGLVVLVVLICGLVGISWQVYQKNVVIGDLTESQTKLQGEVDKSRAIYRYLIEDLLSAPNPQAQGRNVRVVDILDRAAAEIEGRFDDQPEVEAAVRESLGASYRSLGTLDKSQTQLDRAYELRLKTLGSDHPDTLTTLAHLALTAYARGEMAVARDGMTHVYRRRLELLGPYHEDTLTAGHDVATLTFSAGDQDTAFDLLQRVVRDREEQFGPDHERTLLARRSLASMYLSRGMTEKHEELTRVTLERLEVKLGSDHPDTVLTRQSLFTKLHDWGRLENPAATLESLLEQTVRVFGPDHYDTFRVREALAMLQARDGRFAEADVEFRTLIRLRSAVQGEHHAETLDTRLQRARLLRSNGDDASAEAIHRDVLRLRQAHLEADHPSVALSMVGLATLLVSQEHYDEAELLLRDAIEIYRERFKTPHGFLSEALFNLGVVLRRVGRATEAVPIAREGLELDIAIHGDEHLYVASDRASLGWLLIETDQPSDAVDLFRRAFEVQDARMRADDRDAPMTRIGWGLAILDSGRIDPGIDHIIAGLDRLRPLGRTDDRRVQLALGRLIEVLDETERSSRADPYRELFEPKE